MTLLGILLALIAERALSHIHAWREHSLLSRHTQWLAKRLGRTRVWRSRFLVVILLTPTLSAIAALQWWLGGQAYGLPAVAFGFVTLLLALGPRDVAEQLHALRSARLRGDADEEAALSADLRDTPDQYAGDPGCAESRSLLGAAFIQLHERTLAVLLWFFVLGPLGAVGYRLIAALPRELKRTPTLQAEPMRGMELAVRLHGIVAWPTIRLCALLFALSGSTDDAAAERRRIAHAEQPNWVLSGWRQLSAAGVGSLNVEEGDSGPVAPASFDAAIDGVLAVRFRSLLLLLAALALPTIGGAVA